MTTIDNSIYESPLCIIKRHKGRGRYELYIHDAELRDFIKSHIFDVIAEDLQATKPLKKKMLFKDILYGKILISLLETINFRRRTEDANFIQDYLKAFANKCSLVSTALNKDGYQSEPDYLSDCYQGILSGFDEHYGNSEQAVKKSQ